MATRFNSGGWEPMIGGPYSPADPDPWDPSEDGCPECGRAISQERRGWICRVCGLFDADGDKIAKRSEIDEFGEDLKENGPADGESAGPREERKETVNAVIM